MVLVRYPWSSVREAVVLIMGQAKGLTYVYLSDIIELTLT